MTVIIVIHRRALSAAPGTGTIRWANAWTADLSKADVKLIQAVTRNDDNNNHHDNASNGVNNTHK